jgi:transcriptional regulator with XRE-family HTH domain
MSNLKVLREINNYTQEYVAFQLGIDQSSYSKIERNPRTLRSEQLEKLSKLYKVSVSDIMSTSVSVSFPSESDVASRVIDHEKEEIKLYDIGEDLQTTNVSISFENTQKGYGYINNLNEEFQAEAFVKIITSKDDQIKELKEQIEYLKRQNNQLLALLGEK